MSLRQSASQPWRSASRHDASKCPSTSSMSSKASTTLRTQHRPGVGPDATRWRRRLAAPWAELQIATTDRSRRSLWVGQEFRDCLGRPQPVHIDNRHRDARRSGSRTVAKFLKPSGHHVSAHQEPRTSGTVACRHLVAPRIRRCTAVNGWLNIGNLPEHVPLPIRSVSLMTTAAPAGT